MIGFSGRCNVNSLSTLSDEQDALIFSEKNQRSNKIYSILNLVLIMHQPDFRVEIPANDHLFSWITFIENELNGQHLIYDQI